MPLLQTGVNCEEQPCKLLGLLGAVLYSNPLQDPPTHPSHSGEPQPGPSPGVGAVSVVGGAGGARVDNMNRVC